MDIVIRRIAESLASRAHCLAAEGRVDAAEAMLNEADAVLESYNAVASDAFRADYEATVAELSRYGIMVVSKYLADGL